MTLFKKAARGIWGNKRAYISCIVLIAIGIMTYTAFNAVFVDLEASRVRYYSDRRFADVFATVKSMPRDQLGRLSEIEGIAAYTARLSEEIQVLREGNSAVRLVINTYDPDDGEPVNDFSVIAGDKSRGGIVLGKAFALAGGLNAGDEITLNIKGRAVTLPITGIAESPEFIYHIRSLYEMLPDPLNYGYAYMDYRDFAPLVNESGRVNSIGFLLLEGYVFEDVRYTLEDNLEAFGLTALTKQEDQLSNNMLVTELKSLGSMASALPTVFIGMSVIMLYIMLRRIIGQERTQIGILKAYGHSTSQIIGHYLGYGALVGFAGGALGALLGHGLAMAMNSIYSEYFSLPRLSSGFNPYYSFMGVFIATICGIAGAFFGATGVLKLSPSEAMRPASPPPVKFDLLNRLGLIKALLATTGRMAMRSIDRGRFRSLFVAMGVCFSFGIMAFTGSYGDMFDSMLFDQFTKVEVYDIKVNLKALAPYGTSRESAWALPGVTDAEGILEIPVELIREHRNTGAVLTGIENSAQLYRIYDSDKKAFLPPPSMGLVLGEALAGELEVSVGDRVRMKSPYFKKDVTITVLNIIKQSIGGGCYISMDSLWEAMGSPPVVSGLLLRTKQPDEVKSSLMIAGNVSSVSHQQETVEKYASFFDTYMPMIGGMQLIGIVIAFAIISTTSSISLGERKREYATLRVLGMQPGEVGNIMTFEYWLLTVVGMAMGIPLTYWLKISVTAMMDTEMFSIPLYTPPMAFVQAALGCAVAVLLVSRSMRRQVAKFDLIEVLKERE